MNQIVRRDLGADLIHARENSNFRGVMYTNFIVYHVPVIVKNDISVSICSNVPGFTQPHHIVKSISEKQPVIDMIKYMMEIQTRVSSILKDKFSELFQRLDTYRESLIDKATAVKSKQATHEWDEHELQEVQQYIADFMPMDQHYLTNDRL